MFSNKFGIEIEFTGITREQAAEAAAKFLGGSLRVAGGYYGAYEVITPDRRIWKFMSDGSINCQKKQGSRIVNAGGSYSVELVSPVLTYREDIAALQGLVRRLKKTGGFANSSCGIHVHLDGGSHTPRSLWNFANLVASRNDLFYKAFQIPAERMRYCKKMPCSAKSSMNIQKRGGF